MGYGGRACSRFIRNHALNGEREILLAKGGTGWMSKAGGTADLVFIRPGAEGILRRGVLRVCSFCWKKEEQTDGFDKEVGV